MKGRGEGSSPNVILVQALHVEPIGLFSLYQKVTSSSFEDPLSISPMNQY
jgi:hypothetical protein